MNDKPERPHATVPRQIYIEKLRRELDRRVPIDAGTRERFISEIDEHIRCLIHDISSSEISGKQAELVAIEKMESPSELAESLRRADKAARRTSPLAYKNVVLKNWLEILHVRSAVLLAIAVTCFAIFAAQFFLEVIPEHRQEFWVIPTIATAVFGFFICVGRFIYDFNEGPISKASAGWLIFLAIGANLATMAAEFFESLDSHWSLQLAYAAFVISFALFLATAFSQIFFSERTNRWRFFKIAMPVIATSFISIVMVVSCLLDDHQGVIYCLFVATAVVIVYSVRRYVSFMDLARTHSWSTS